MCELMLAGGNLRAMPIVQKFLTLTLREHPSNARSSYVEAYEAESRFYVATAGSLRGREKVR